MRVLKYAMVVSALLFVYIAIVIPVPPNQPVSQSFEIAITFAGIACLIGGFVFPRILFQTPSRIPHNNSTDAQLKQWMAKGLLGLASFEACILFGLVLHFLQARVWLVELLFGLGITAELIWSPGAPPAAQSGEFPPD